LRISNEETDMRHLKLAVMAVALLLVAAACSGDAATTTTGGEVGEEEHHEDADLHLEAAMATISVDGDDSDWSAIDGIDLTLKPIEGEDIEEKDATVKVATDGSQLFVLFIVEDDYDWDADDAHLSGSPSVMWLIDSGAGPHMGTEAEGEQSSYESLGMVDIWHWELECGPGEQQGGAVSAADSGNDPGCNFDDEWATDPETREDDDAENSLLGVFTHTDSEPDGDGHWIFEMSRPLTTEDAQDAQFAAGQTAMMALAYWDPDNDTHGWGDDEHVQSAYLGWIEVNLVG
jgi:hypothetical protein